MAERQLSGWSVLVLAACAIGLGVFGAIALADWHTESARLFLSFRLHYDSAWAFLFCAMSLLAFLGGSHRGSAMCAAVVVVIGAARWAAYFRPDLGLSVHPLLANPALVAGEYDDLPLSVATGFILVGTALFSLRRPPYSAARSIFIALLGFATLILALFLFISSQSHVSIVFYWLQLDIKDPANAFAFFLIACSILFFILFGHGSEQVEARRWMPLAVWLAVMIGSVGLWQAMRLEQVETVHSRTRFAGNAVKTEIESNMRARIGTLQRVAFRWQSSRMHREQWNLEMTRLLGDVPEYRALAWADSQLILRWLVPAGSYETGINLLADKRRAEAVEAAQLNRSPALTGLIDLEPGQKGMHIYVPVYFDDQFQGLMIGMFLRATWLESLLRDQFSEYSISLVSGGDAIGELHADERVDDGRWLYRLPITLYNTTWTLEVAPKRPTVDAALTLLPQIALVVGALLATLLAFVVLFFQVALRNIGNAAAANRLLRQDIEMRQHAERALVESERKNRLVVEEARDHYFGLFSEFPNLVWRSDPSGKCDYCNQAWFDFTGTTLDGARGDEWLNSMHSEDRAGWIEAFAQAGQKKKPFEIQFRLRRKDGQYGWIICTCRPYHNVRGEFAGYLASCYDNSTRRQMESELEESRERMRSFSRHLQTVREDEKTRIARELHDELGATLTALRMDSSWLSARLADGEATALKKSRGITQLADSAIQVIRRIITELRPSILDNLGLVPALRWQAAEFQGRAGFNVSVWADDDEIAVDKAQAIVFFRIFQEALTNIAKHASAKNVSVRFSATGFSHILEVSDDGVGISEDALANRRGHGILGMEERAHELGGECVVESEPGKGTTVRVSLPWNLSRDDI